MKRSLALVLTLASGFALSAAAQTPAASAATPASASGPTKIAVIAFQVAVAQTNEGQRNFADLQKKFDPRREQLKKLSDEVDAMTKQLQADQAKLTPAEQQSRATAIDNKKKQLDRDGQDASSDFQQEMQDVYNSLASKVYDVLQSYAELHGYTLVLDVSQQQNPVLYANNSNNITKEVIDAYNVKSGIPAPPAQPAGSTEAPAPRPAAPRPAAPRPAAPRTPPTTK
ncbi:MAG TPA: OmpH family outer membrane protein [Terracidiphilus sp.]|jgi:outer membrane protein|nr:OmpH family outer membrane protein [Terracidiphilus sp.]